MAMIPTIVYDSQIFFLQRYGGISRYFYELASCLVKSPQFHTKILAPAYINQYLRKLDPRYIIGLPIPEISKTVRLRAAVNRSISRLISTRICPDLVHETYYSFANVLSKKSKIVITIHDMIPEKFNRSFPRSDLTALFKAKAIKRADGIICVSENTRKDLLEKFDVDPHKVFVTHLGCSFQPISQPPVISKFFPRPYLLYVGHRGNYKNFSKLLEAYTLAKSLKRDFSLICFGGSPFSRLERDKFHQHKLTSEHIQYIEGNDAVLSSLYTNASAFIYPSLYEGFGIPPLEAMSCKCPVICSDRSSIPEVVGDAAEFFDPYAPESIVNAIEKVVYSPERTQILIQLGLERVKHFSWRNCATQTAAIYTSLL